MKKKVFVIMPFVEANGRDQSSLTKFFEDHIKHPIEESFDLGNRFEVLRSSDDFLILDNILLDLANADMVVCDLSGIQANPNVIYELGIRFSISHRPAILIREQAETNKSMFDVAGLHTFHYNLRDPKALEKYLVNKVKEYESDPAKYTSPVLKILNHEAAFWMQLPIRKASAFLGGIASAAEANLGAFARAVANHLRGQGKDELYVKSTDTVYRTISDFADEPGLFENFDYHISSIPSLDSYLSSVYLLGLVEEGVEKKFRTYAMNYSLYFNRGNSRYFWSNRFLEALAYAKETLILMNLCRTTIKILKAKPDSDERRSLITTVDELISKSEFSELNG